MKQTVFQYGTAEEKSGRADTTAFRIGRLGVAGSCETVLGAAETRTCTHREY
jgi:hypothetical protein